MRQETRARDRRVSRRVAAAIFGATFAVYLRTLAPSITWRNQGADSGDLVTAALTGGVPHPPGYPLYTTLAQFAAAIPIGASAFRVNVLSAGCAALAAVAVFWIARALIFRSTWRVGIAAACAGAFAFSPRLWSQATIAEVYALNALLTAAILGGILFWRESPCARWLAALAFGLGLAHHPTIVLLAPGAMLLLWRRVTWRAGLGALALALAIALALDLTLILRAASDPPINWGDPRTLDRWAWVISGALYRNFIFGVPIADYPARVLFIAQSFLDQFGVLGMGLALFGAFTLARRARRVGLAFGATFLAYGGFTLGYASTDALVYLIPADLVMALWIAVGCGALAEALIPHGRWVALMLGVLISSLPLGNLAGNFAALDLSNDQTAREYGRAVFATLPPDALIVADHDPYVFALGYARYVEQPNSRALIVVPGLLAFDWYRAQLQRQYPAWIFPAWTNNGADDFLAALVRANLARYPLYWAEPDAAMERRLVFQPVGNLNQVVGVRH